MNHLRSLMYARHRIDIFRAAGRVKRHHTSMIIGEECVGQHSWGVLIILMEIMGDAITVPMMKHAVRHDLHELSFGDIPAPAKWASPQLKEGARLLAREFEVEFEIQPSLSSQEHLIFKCADMLDLMFFHLDQLRMGNKATEHIFENASRVVYQYLKDILDFKIATKICELWDHAITERTHLT